jgi:hypothetical protein
VCNFFDYLDPILADRPSTKPLCTNKDTPSNTPNIESVNGANLLIMAFSPESVKVSNDANKKLTSASVTSKKKLKKNESNNDVAVPLKKSIMPTKKHDKKDPLLKFAIAMQDKIALQSKRFELESMQMKMQMKFETLKYRQQLRDLNVPEEEIEKSFPLLDTENAGNATSNIGSTVNIESSVAQSALNVSFTTKEEDDTSSAT